MKTQRYPMYLKEPTYLILITGMALALMSTLSAKDTFELAISANLLLLDAAILILTYGWYSMNETTSTSDGPTNTDSLTR